VKEDLKQYVDEYMREKKQILLSLQRNEDIKIQKDSIKNLGDQAIFLFRFLKVFRVKVDAGLDTSELYNEIDALIDNVPLTKQYDAIRNYLTKKPFSEEKMKLNFDCSTLL
jgi:CRISPR-associated protein Cpf1